MGSSGINRIRGGSLALCGDPQQLAQRLSEADGPQVVLIQNPCNHLTEFASAVEAKPPLHPFVLLAVSGNLPFTREMQTRVAKLPNLKACYATEMHRSASRESLFHPMPLGVPHHPVEDNSRQNGLTTVNSVIGKVAASAKPWSTRENRLLVIPMEDTHPSRLELLYLLSGSNFKDMVHILTKRLGYEEYLSLASQFKVVLSPPGLSYDCYRTWEVLAVGSAPALYDPRDQPWDTTLYNATGLSDHFLPALQNLTPQSLKSFLDNLQDPAPIRHYVNGTYWESKWRDHFSTL